MTDHAPITSPADYGLDDAALETIEAVGAANTPEPKRKGPRANSLTPARACLIGGTSIPYLELGSAQNPAATDKGWALWKLYAGTDAAGLQAFVIGGSNTYSKLLKGYRDILLASTAAGIEPDGETIAAYQAAWDRKQELKAAAKMGARAARKAAKAPTPAEPGPYAAVPTPDLEATAKGLEELISAERTTADRELQDDRRARAKAMRKELASRLTPEDKAATAKVAASLKAAVAPKAKPTPTAADTALVARGGKAPKVPEKAPEKAVEAPAAASAAKAPDKPKVAVFASLMGARKAARDALGAEAIEGVDFKIAGKGKRLSWIPIGMNAPKA
jgi:hypothetical protein